VTDHMNGEDTYLALQEYLKQDQAMQAKQYIKVGERVATVLPHSEVCCHMKVNGTVCLVELQPAQRMVQLYTTENRPISFPITTGEAGVRQDENGFWIVPVADLDAEV